MLIVPGREELRRRLPRLGLGLVCFGVGLALMVLAELGLGPWDVLHQGVSQRTGVPIGTVGIGVGVVLLLAWLPLRQRPGLGTLANVVVVGLVIDLTLAAADPPSGLAARWALLLGGIVLTAVGSGLYIGAGLGPGPRDGIMTGLAERGLSVAAARTAIELGALGLGWALGGTVGVGTVLFAFGIGPLVQLFLGRFALAPRPRTTGLGE